MKTGEQYVDKDTIFPNLPSVGLCIVWVKRRSQIVGKLEKEEHNNEPQEG